MVKRNIRFEVCFTREEIATLKNKAKKCGFSTGGYIREIVAGSIPREKPDERFYDVMRELSAIGNRVNQIAAKANALNFIDEIKYKEVAKDLAKFQTKIQKEFLGPERTK